jgi:hypothetical protein
MVPGKADSSAASVSCLESPDPCSLRFAACGEGPTGPSTVNPAVAKAAGVVSVVSPPETQSQ